MEARFAPKLVVEHLLAFVVDAKYEAIVRGAQRPRSHLRRGIEVELAVKRARVIRVYVEPDRAVPPVVRPCADLRDARAIRRVFYLIPRLAVGDLTSMDSAGAIRRNVKPRFPHLLAG